MYIKVLQVLDLTRGMMEDVWSITPTPSLCAVIFWLPRDQGVVCLLAFRSVISLVKHIMFCFLLFRLSDECWCEGWHIDKLYTYWIYTYQLHFLNWRAWNVFQCIFICSLVLWPPPQPVLFFLRTHRVLDTCSVMWIILWQLRHHWSAINGQLADESTWILIPEVFSIFLSYVSYGTCGCTRRTAGWCGKWPFVYRRSCSCLQLWGLEVLLPHLGRNHGRLVLNNARYFETMCNETTVETMAHSLLELLTSTIS